MPFWAWPTTARPLLCHCLTQIPPRPFRIPNNHFSLVLPAQVTRGPFAFLPRYNAILLPRKGRLQFQRVSNLVFPFLSTQKTTKKTINPGFHHPSPNFAFNFLSSQSNPKIVLPDYSIPAVLHFSSSNRHNFQYSFPHHQQPIKRWLAAPQPSAIGTRTS